MRSAAPPDAETDSLVALERTASTAEPAKLVQLLGDLERVKASVWQRLLLLVTTAQAGPTNPAEDLRHLTPQQVGETLSVKAAYVHELCRTGRIPAIKTGKYWMIPVARLRQWLAYQDCDIDGGQKTHVPSLYPPGHRRPTSRTALPVGAAEARSRVAERTADVERGRLEGDVTRVSRRGLHP